ncbi:MAG: hypothetical protein JXR36_09575 [Bacteroidales bacterium]|nr:hypothetical protein [Bacteroidales bacterium]
MRKNLYFLTLASTAIILLLFACNTNTNQNDKNAKNNQNPEKELNILVQQWNDAHNNNDYDVFQQIFADSVNFYQMKLIGNTCVDKKESLLQKYPDFKQSIGKIDFEEIDNSTYKASFTKTVKVSGNIHEYPSYLVITKTKSGWKITEESDLITDENIAKMNLPKGAVAGDFNSDGAPEFMWLNAPDFPKDKSEDSFGECKGECTCYIEFSDKSIPPIEIEMCIGGNPINEGDLNNNGCDEIGILPHWWTSCWSAYYVFTLKNGKWENLVEPISTHCDQWDKGIEVISKTSKKPGYVTINYSELSDDGIVVKTKQVKL